MGFLGGETLAGFWLIGWICDSNRQGKSQHKKANALSVARLTGVARLAGDWLVRLLGKVVAVTGRV